MNTRRIIRKLRALRHQYLTIGLKESAYFFCLHKTASSLFDHYLLKHVCGLLHKSYATSIYLNHTVPNQLDFQSRGYVYGPVRISAEPDLPVYTKLVKPCTELNFIKDKKLLIMIRDPRDIIVSSYYSFGFNHRLSPNPVIARFQQNRREQIQQKSIDEYAIESAITHLEHFNTIQKLLDQCPNAVLLRYEDLIDNFEHFANRLQTHLKLSQKTLTELYHKSRPRDEEDLSAHKRSGMVGDYKNKLKPETIHVLNQHFQDHLKRHGYASIA
ncbi:MAG: sulfotransferase domain-containing protein [Bacteroidia bacterium]